MIEKKIFLGSVDSINRFLTIVEDKPYDIELTGGKKTVNGKSLMCILLLDLTKPVILHAHCDKDPRFMRDIEQFTV